MCWGLYAYPFSPPVKTTGGWMLWSKPSKYRGSKNKAIKMLEDALDNKGRLKNDSCEVILQMRIDSFINIVRGSETYGTSVYKYDSTKNIVSNFNNINILSEDC